MGFSTSQDPDVLAYKQLRAKVLAQEHMRTDAARDARAREMERLRLKTGEKQGGIFKRLMCGKGGRKAVSVGGAVVTAKKLEEDSDYESEDEFEKVDIKTVLKH